MSRWDEFTGPNAAYLWDLYERFQKDPQSVEPGTRAFFEQNPPPPDGHVKAEMAVQLPRAQAPAAAASADAIFYGAAALNLAQAVRNYGHWAARLDPLGKPPPDDPALHLETYGLTEAILRGLPAGIVTDLSVEDLNGRVERVERSGRRLDSAYDAIEWLREVYSGRIGYDYLQIRNPQERAWLREAAESRRYTARGERGDGLGRKLLERLTQVEVFEHFLQRAFTGKTRFSVEGLDTLIPLMDEVIGCAAEGGIYNILIGMAHRGRLNVLAHILNKPIAQILAEFKDPLQRRLQQNEPHGWAGDVKYHAGARREIDPDDDPSTINLTVTMAPNPSHLEAVNPVVAGMARAAGTRADRPGPALFDPSVTLPLVIHGDAAFMGQGVVAETLNMYRLHGYTTGGTIHVIANNQIGFTTDPNEARSTLFASDMAKGFRIPVIHVNADDPEGVIEAARIAFAYRERFKRDFLIDLIGYRRMGHNEGDEPGFTQPLMYAKISAHPTVRAQWAAELERRGEVEPGEADRLYQQGMDALQAALDSLDPETLEEPIPPVPPAGAAKQTATAVEEPALRQMFADLNKLPEGFNLHPRLARIRQRRAGMLDGDADWPAVDWTAAEELALASILSDGTPVRLTGQDAERGTFSHRHAVLHDAQSGAQHVPLQKLPSARAAFDVFNSPLSEYAALGFEFGFDIEARQTLVIWEAQYGDFINNAQGVVDEFLLTARDKWGQLPALVLLLPHGWEGQGPDHSSGRLERFLSLSADYNLRVANCTTAANYFHLLRRQAALLERDPLPLVVMTPKSLLRHPLTLSPLRAFSQGAWQPVIDRQPPPAKEKEQPGPLPPAEGVRRVVLCSGKIYVDLLTSEIAREHPEVALVRVEQLAPFPEAEVSAVVKGYTKAEEIFWAQEEPENMGAWEYARPYLEKLAGKQSLRVAARPRSASPAEGSSSSHMHNQKALIEKIFNH